MAPSRPVPAIRSETPTVDLRHLERARLHALQAAHVDGDHRRAIALFPAREGLNSAPRAEKVVDVHLVELVVDEPFVAREEFELVGRDEREKVSLSRADRAVASNDLL